MNMFLSHENDRICNDAADVDSIAELQEHLSKLVISALPESQISPI